MAEFIDNVAPVPQFDWLKSIWNIKTSPKIKDFLWKVVRKAIPVSSNLSTGEYQPFPVRPVVALKMIYMCFYTVILQSRYGF